MNQEIKNIQLLSPSSGIINSKKGDTIHFKMEYKGYFNELQINTNIFRNPDIWMEDETSKHKKIKILDTFALKRQRYVSFTRSRTFYEFEYIVPDNSLYYIDILFDRKRVMRLKVAITN